MEYSRASLAVESWTLYALGVGLILSRIICRFITLRSLSNLQLDDWLMLLVLIPFTGATFFVNEAYTANNMTALDPDIMWRRKAKFMFEELRIIANWSVKACLLILYWRIFPALTSKREWQYMTWLSASCVLAYIAIQTTLPLWCYPTHNYWLTSSQNSQCATYRNHAILSLILTATTTTATMIIPVPFIPTPRRFLQVLLFLVGISILSSGVLARSFTLSSPGSSTYLHWLIAESFLTILFANLPFLSSVCTSPNARSIRKMSSNISFSHWPRSNKDTPPLHAQRERLDSTDATIIATPPAAKLAGSSPQVDLWDGWGDKDTPFSAPTTLVRQMTLTDPPPELEGYWSARGTDVRDSDVESVGVREIHWPLR